MKKILFFLCLFSAFSSSAYNSYFRVQPDGRGTSDVVLQRFFNGGWMVVNEFAFQPAYMSPLDTSLDVGWYRSWTTDNPSEYRWVYNGNIFTNASGCDSWWKYDPNPVEPDPLWWSFLPHPPTPNWWVFNPPDWSKLPSDWRSHLPPDYPVPPEGWTPPTFQKPPVVTPPPPVVLPPVAPPTPTAPPVSPPSAPVVPSNPSPPSAPPSVPPSSSGGTIDYSAMADAVEIGLSRRNLSDDEISKGIYSYASNTAILHGIENQKAMERQGLSSSNLSGAVASSLKEVGLTRDDMSLAVSNGFASVPLNTYFQSALQGQNLSANEISEAIDSRSAPRIEVANALLADIKSGVLSANNLTEAQMAAINAYILTAQGHYTKVEDALLAQAGFRDRTETYYSEVKDALALIARNSSNSAPVSVTNNLSLVVTNDLSLSLTNNLSVVVTNNIDGIYSLSNAIYASGKGIEDKLDALLGDAVSLPVMAEFDGQGLEVEPVDVEGAGTVIDGILARGTSFFSTVIRPIFPSALSSISSVNVSLGGSSVTLDWGSHSEFGVIRSMLVWLIGVLTFFGALSLIRSGIS